MLEAAQPSQDGFASTLTIAACSCVALLGRVFKNVDLQHLAANRPTFPVCRRPASGRTSGLAAIKRHRAGVAPTSQADANLAPSGARSRRSLGITP